MNNLLISLRKKSLPYRLMALAMALALALQNASYAQHAFAHEDGSMTVEASSSETNVSDVISHVEDSVQEQHQDRDEGEMDSHDRDESDRQEKSVHHDGDRSEKEDGAHRDGDEGDDRGTLHDVMHDMNTAKPALTLIATKIVCDAESKLPNWGLGGPDITSHTASDYVAAHPGCVLAPDWKFQWGFSSVKDLGRDFVGEANGSLGAGSQTGTGVSDWKTFGATDASGVAMTKIYDLAGSPRIWVREVLKDGYIPFTYDTTHLSNADNVSAEMYCSGDVLNYDNYDYVNQPALGNTYYCVAWNALKTPPHQNTAPVITVVGANPATVYQDATYNDLGATVFDAEEGDITPKLVRAGSVDTHVLGVYTITYNATDSQNLAATPKTRTVNVVAKPVCTSDCPVNHPPVITLIGANPLEVTLGSIFADPGATAFDLEDGTITPSATGTVNTASIGTYLITYTAMDSQGATATPKTRTVNVVSAGCAPSCGGATNTPPVITLLGDNPITVYQNSIWTDPGATAFDLEDGTITPTVSGTVNTAATGTYLIVYNATDSQGATATPKTRTVSVVPVGTPINQKPVITLLGDIILQLTVGTPFTDPGATASDPEDGDITAKIIASGVVDANTIGTYTITYNATDSQNLAADQRTRTVNVVAVPTTGCTVNCGGGSSTFDYFGCTDPAATNYNRLANKNDGSCRYPGGGGGGGSVPLTITNEKLVVSGTTSVTITWNTNLPSDSRVVYGDAAVTTLGTKPGYGYPLSTATDTTYLYNHTMVITGVPSAIKTYFRPVSATASETATGIELVRTPDVAAPAACEYLKEYLRLGTNNNPSEVTKLQLFLKNYEGFTSLAVTGFFDITTDAAVRAFQDKYKKDVLDAWNLPSNTGYVYYTTKKKINEIYCQREFPLSDAQKSEIAEFRSLIERVNAGGAGAPTVTLPIVGSNVTSGSASAGSVAGASTVSKSPVTVTVTKTNDYAALDREAGKGESEALTPENRGRIAIADLLATAPSVAKSVSIETEEGDALATGTEAGEVLGENDKRGLLAAVSSSISSRFASCSPMTYLLSLVFLILAIVFGALYFKKDAAPAAVAPEAPATEKVMKK